MDIVIIGSGNVAAVLGRKLRAAGHTIVQVLSRNAAAASELAYEWDTESANYLTLINKQADIYIIAVSDNAIATIADELQLPGKIVVHTAASVPAAVLSTVSADYGILYPLQSLRKEMDYLPDMPLYFDGHTDKVKAVLKTLADSISSRPAALATDEQRLKLHVAAVLVSNFVNHLYALAEDYCKKEGLDFAQLLPLIIETAARVKEIAPLQAQTGPAIRQDKETMEKHLQLLSAHPGLQTLYVLLSDSIRQLK